MSARLIQKCVVVHADSGGSGHDLQTTQALARWLAEILGWSFRENGQADNSQQPLYWVPTETLIGEQLDELNISGADDLLGGYVQHPFVATKAISHPLIAQARSQPDGWNPQFCERVRDVVLPGVTVFDPEDARQAAMAGLRKGALRVKQVEASGGSCQTVLHNQNDVEKWLSKLDAATCGHGIVLEENLNESVTYSVGQTLIDGLLMTYFGQQEQKQNSRGESVYGGSELLIVRGDYIELLARELKPDVRRAIEYARTYDTAAALSFPGFFASRRNYDVVQGQGSDGSLKVGVLEQSWRVGGATGAELAALQALRERPQTNAVRASTHEKHEEQAAPEGARVLYSGPDGNGDFLLKFARIDAYDC